MTTFSSALGSSFHSPTPLHLCCVICYVFFLFTSAQTSTLFRVGGGRKGSNIFDLHMCVVDIPRLMLKVKHDKNDKREGMSLRG